MRICPGEQLSSEWFQAHCGVVSGSYMASVLQLSKNGSPGAKRQTYQRMKLAELVTGAVVQDNYVSREMMDGIEREPAGRVAYEIEEGVSIEEVGFALHDSIPRFGGSVDGLVGDEGALELKCPKPGTHLKWILDGCIPPAHIPQLDSYLAITGRQWIDFATFCPLIKVKELRLMIIRRERSDAQVEWVEQAAIRFNAEIDAMVQQLRDIAGPFDLPAAMADKVSRAEQFTAEDDAGLGLSDEDIAWAQRGFTDEETET
jgi:YqaJ-like viral recombinase domain